MTSPIDHLHHEFTCRYMGKVGRLDIDYAKEECFLTLNFDPARGLESSRIQIDPDCAMLWYRLIIPSRINTDWMETGKVYYTKGLERPTGGK